MCKLGIFCSYIMISIEVVCKIFFFLMFEGNKGGITNLQIITDKEIITKLFTYFLEYVTVVILYFLIFHCQMKLDLVYPYRSVWQSVTALKNIHFHGKDHLTASPSGPLMSEASRYLLSPSKGFSRSYEFPYYIPKPLKGDAPLAEHLLTPSCEVMNRGIHYTLYLSTSTVWYKPYPWGIKICNLTFCLIEQSNFVNRKQLHK